MELKYNCVISLTSVRKTSSIGELMLLKENGTKNIVNKIMKE